MTADPNCIFCKIAAGTIPSAKLYEDGETLAFMDINPANDGHCLVIPKAHFPTVFAIAPEAFAAAGRTVIKVASAVQAALQPDGINLLQANGQGAPRNRCSISISMCCRGGTMTVCRSTGRLGPAIAHASRRSPRRSASISETAPRGLGGGT